jgi:hypothetical protein
MRRAVRRLKDSELADAEHLERLGKRRINNLLMLRAERKRRLKSHHMMMRLTAEVKL